MKDVYKIAAHIFPLVTLQQCQLCVRLSNATPAACQPRTLKLTDSRELMLHGANIWTKTSFSLRGASVGPRRPARRRDVDIV